MSTLQETELGADFLLPTGKFGKVGVCRTIECKQKVVFVRLPSGKTPPFNEDGTSHFSTCVGAADWKGRARTRADGSDTDPRRGEADGTRGMQRGS